MKVIILAGGFGTRLKSAVSSVPKPLAPVMGKPFLSFQMENWTSQGITEFIFLLHYEAKKIIISKNNKSFMSKSFFIFLIVNMYFTNKKRPKKITI